MARARQDRHRYMLGTVKNDERNETDQAMTTRYLSGLASDG
jgi:hypothetical protein